MAQDDTTTQAPATANAQQREQVDPTERSQPIPLLAAVVTVGVLLFGVGYIVFSDAPGEPTLDRAYIGRTFCVVVMAGLGSISGTLIAAIILGVAETIVLTMFGASWAPAISFGMLLAVLAVRPQGLLGR